MTWQLFNSYLIGVNTNNITIPTNFTDSELVIRTTPVTTKPNWRYFGELELWTSLINIGEVRLSTSKLKLGTNLIKVNSAYPYELKLIAYYWLPDINIDIYRDI